MKALVIFAAVSLLAVSASAKEPIELLCKAQYLRCEENECWRFDKPEWLFNLKSFFGKHTQELDFIIDEKKQLVQVNGTQYSTDPELGGATIPYVNLKVSPSSIGMTIISHRDCHAGGACKSAINERININRINGELLHRLISTDGSIKEVPLGDDYAQFFGYCVSDIKRQF